MLYTIPLPSNMSNNKVLVSLIQGNRSFFGNIIRETSKGYYITWPDTNSDLGNSVGEWFAKDSQIVTCTLVKH